MELFFISLEKNPFELKLKTHKVQSKVVYKAWSSRISGDLRVIWDFNQDKIGVINLLDIGGHSGKNKVY